MGWKEKANSKKLGLSSVRLKMIYSWKKLLMSLARTNEIPLIDGNRILKVEIRVYELVKFALCWGCRKIMGGSELGLLF